MSTRFFVGHCTVRVSSLFGLPKTTSCNQWWPQPRLYIHCLTDRSENYRGWFIWLTKAKCKVGFHWRQDAWSPDATCILEQDLLHARVSAETGAQYWRFFYSKTKAQIFLSLGFLQCTILLILLISSALKLHPKELSGILCRYVTLTTPWGQVRNAFVEQWCDRHGTPPTWCSNSWPVNSCPD